MGLPLHMGGPILPSPGAAPAALPNTGEGPPLPLEHARAAPAASACSANCLQGDIAGTMQEAASLREASKPSERIWLRCTALLSCTGGLNCTAGEMLARYTSLHRRSQLYLGQLDGKYMQRQAQQNRLLSIFATDVLAEASVLNSSDCPGSQRFQWLSADIACQHVMQCS